MQTKTEVGGSLNSFNVLNDCPFTFEVFSLFGLPTQIISYNGPSFNSVEFVQVCQVNGIKPLKWKEHYFIIMKKRYQNILLQVDY